jgi:hypothetical protein
MKAAVMATLKIPSCKASSRAFGNMAIPRSRKAVIAGERFEGEMTESRLFMRKH